jgi:NAD dependent epimerase/dehydratase family enzyme
MPAFAARLALGEMADELLLGSTRVEPKQFVQSGYEFRQPTLEVALRHLLGRAGRSLPNDQQRESSELVVQQVF